MHDHLRCNKCKNLSISPVECIKCNVIFCEGCKPSNKCSSCNNLSQFAESALAKRMIGSLKINCIHCKQEITISELEDHLKICIAKPISCNELNCNFSGSKKMFIEHLNNKHMASIVAVFTKSTKEVVSDKMDLFNPKLNSKGNATRRGSNNKFYC